MCPTISDFYFHSPLYVATWRREVCSCVYTWFRIIFLVKFLLIELLLLCLRMRRDKFYLNIYLKRRCSIKCKKRAWKQKVAEFYMCTRSFAWIRRGLLCVYTFTILLFVSCLLLLNGMMSSDIKLFIAASLLFFWGGGGIKEVYSWDNFNLLLTIQNLAEVAKTSWFWDNKGKRCCQVE